MVCDGFFLKIYKAGHRVLILVVVEDGLRRPPHKQMSWGQRCLNPCCSGRWSATVVQKPQGILGSRLNPCCSGRWSATHLKMRYRWPHLSLNPCCSGRWSATVEYKENK